MLSKKKTARPLPGEEGIWMFVAGDMIVFALFFSAFLYYRGQDVALFDRSQHLLDTNLGAFNTFLLLTSSWAAAIGVQAVREGKPGTARAMLSGATLCGIGFIIVKIVEYHQKLASGITLVTNDFFMYYFMLTGIHLVHVIIGTCVLAALAIKARTASSADIRLFEDGAIFWHMVDLLWIMLFPLLYLVSK